VRAMTIVVVLVLALLGASCGGDDETAADTDTVVTETEGITAEDTTTDETTDDDDGSFATAECSELVAAAASVATAFSGTAATDDADETQAQFEEFAENAPDEIQDDLQVLVDAYELYAEALADVDIQAGEVPDAEDLQELQDAIASIDQAEVTEASENINAWTAANC
jgi:hypothetical protein